MPVRIRIQNFQSIADATLVVDRFTVITGANNSGKTAVIRAVQGAFSNAPGDAFVRYGTEKLSVELTFDDGQSVRWEKGPKVKPTYYVAGKVLHPGRAVPDEVLALGVRSITVGQVPVWPQVAKQFTGQVFLLDLPGSSVAEAVADVDRVGKLTQALRFADSDKRAASADLRVRRQDVETGKRELDAYAGVDVVEASVVSIDAHIKDALLVEGETTQAKGFHARIRAAEAEIHRFAGVREVQVPDASLVASASKLGTQAAEARKLRVQIEQARATVQTLAGIREVVVPPTPTEAVAARSDVRAAMLLRDRMVASKAVVAGARGAVAVLQNAKLPELETVVASASKASKTLDYVVGLQARLAAGRAEVATLRESLRVKSSLLVESEEEVRVTLSNLGACPTCGSGVPGSHPHGATHG